MGRNVSGGAIRPNWVPRAIIAGFVASFAMVIAFLVGYGVAFLLAESGFAGQAVAGWFAALTSNPVIDVARDLLYLSVAVHLFAGLVWAMIYAYLFEPRLGGPGWGRGVIFSLVPWGLSLIVFLPLTGGGLLGLDIGAGPLPIIGNLILHFVYGSALGAMYRLLVKEDTEVPAERNANLNAEKSASVGIVAGAGIGTVIGVVVAIALQMTSTQATEIFGVSPWMWAISSALLGAAWGGLFGSLAGYHSR